MRLRCDRCGVSRSIGLLHEDAGLQLCARCYGAPARLKLRHVLLAAACIVAAIAIARGARAADQHPAMTADHGPGWQLHRALPGEDFKPRGRFFDNRTGCELDLASDHWASPSGTKLMCRHISSDRKAIR